MCIALFQKKHRAAPDGCYLVFALLPLVVPETDPAALPSDENARSFPQMRSIGLQAATRSSFRESCAGLALSAGIIRKTK
jgi:hypothetical protein